MVRIGEIAPISAIASFHLFASSGSCIGRVTYVWRRRRACAIGDLETGPEGLVEDVSRLLGPTMLVHASSPPSNNLGPALVSATPEKSYWLKASYRPEIAFSSCVYGFDGISLDSWS